MGISNTTIRESCHTFFSLTNLITSSTSTKSQQTWGSTFILNIIIIFLWLRKTPMELDWRSKRKEREEILLQGKGFLCEGRSILTRRDWTLEILGRQIWRPLSMDYSLRRLLPAQCVAIGVRHRLYQICNRTV
jgi:hypothetical protein